jgi:four helix bundle protein
VKIERFEDLECWREARNLNQMIYGLVRRSEYGKDFRLSSQTTGASISIMNNICEGFDASSTSEFIRFLFYSRRSCSELQNCLYIASDQEYITKEDFRNGYNLCERVRQIIDGLIRYLKRSKSTRAGLLDPGQRANGPTGPRKR